MQEAEVVSGDSAAVDQLSCVLSLETMQLISRLANQPEHIRQ